MAATVSTSPANDARGNDVWGRRRVHVFEVDLDASYPTGGESLGLAALGVQNQANATVFVTQVAPVDAGYVFVYDAADDKLVVFWVDTTVDGAALAEVADTTDLSDVTVRLLVVES